jgi:hypothetical protein
MDSQELQKHIENYKLIAAPEMNFQRGLRTRPHL